MTTLEQEFEEYKALHKYSVLKGKLTQYYMDLEAAKPQLPDFLRIGHRPRDKADREIRQLIQRGDGLRRFNELYELAYQSLTEVLD